MPAHESCEGSLVAVAEEPFQQLLVSRPRAIAQRYTAKVLDNLVDLAGRHVGSLEGQRGPLLYDYPQGSGLIPDFPEAWFNRLLVAIPDAFRDVSYIDRPPMQGAC
jgi:hypothetical protein